MSLVLCTQALTETFAHLKISSVPTRTKRPISKGKAFDLSFVRQYLEEFLSTLNRSGEIDPSEVPVWWARPETTIRLSAEEAIQHRRILKETQQKFAPLDDLSEKALDSALKDAIFTVVGTAEPDEQEAAARVNRAVANLRAFLEAEPQAYECWIEIEGVNADTLPSGFGRTTFCVLEPLHISLLKDIVRTKHTIQIDEKLQDIRARQSEDLQGRTVAIQCVKARDSAAALTLAVRELQQTLDCLNFVAKMIPYNRAHLRIARGSSVSQSSARPAIAMDGSYRIAPKSRIPWTFSFKDMSNVSEPVASLVRRIDELLGQDERSPVDELLVRAVVWSGKAAGSESIEDKFLYSVIALESILLPDGSGELNFRLSQLVARILSDDVGSRLKVAQDVKRLYRLRSKLVHDGNFEVTEDDQNMAVTISIETIARLLMDDTVRHLRNRKELQDHFDILMLS